MEARPKEQTNAFEINEQFSLAKRQSSRQSYKEVSGYDAPYGFVNVRVHDLKHTFGRRLRSARVALETRKVLLGHKNGDITTHYSVPEVGELIDAANMI